MSLTNVFHSFQAYFPDKTRQDELRQYKKDKVQTKDKKDKGQQRKKNMKHRKMAKSVDKKTFKEQRFQANERKYYST